MNIDDLYIGQLLKIPGIEIYWQLAGITYVPEIPTLVLRLVPVPLKREITEGTLPTYYERCLKETGCIRTTIFEVAPVSALEQLAGQMPDSHDQVTGP